MTQASAVISYCPGFKMNGFGAYTVQEVDVELLAETRSHTGGTHIVVNIEVVMRDTQE